MIKPQKLIEMRVLIAATRFSVQVCEGLAKTLHEINELCLRQMALSVNRQGCRS